VEPLADHGDAVALVNLTAEGGVHNLASEEAIRVANAGLQTRPAVEDE